MSEAEQVIPTDPMDLSSEEYERSISDLMSTPPEDVVIKDVEQEIEQETDVPDVPDIPDVPDVAEDVVVKDVEQDAEELFEIVYKGEVQKLPRDKVIELAQKGFSYHSDMNRIAPHKKLVTLIEGDEEISTLVNDYVSERAKPTTSKLDDFDTEEAWLDDNLKRQKAAEKFSQAEPTPGQEIIEFFRDKDPENYEKVLGALGDHANQLTMADYQKINGSMDELEKFYDNVKSKVVTETPVVKPKQTFRTRSGGGAPPRQTSTKQKAWEMSSKDFNKMIQTVKGY